MTGLRGTRRLLTLALVQDAALTAAALLPLAVLPTLVRSAAAYDGLIAAALTFTVIALLALLYMMWGNLESRIESLWSFRAKKRVRMWLKPAILIGIALALATIVMTYAIDAMGETVAGWHAWIEALMMLAVAPALVVSGVLTAGLAYRYWTMRKSADRLDHLIDSAAGADLARVRASLDSEAGQSATSTRPNPQGFNFAGISSRPWHEPAAFPWIAGFNAAADQVRAEALAALGRGEADIYKYPGLEGDQWKAVKFVARHEEVLENLAKCPVTAALLKTVPGYPVFRDAMFSVLGPGGVIAPHRDVANVYLTMHFGLVTPGNGFMEVGGLRRPWTAGEAIVFDSSYEHRAVNNSNEARVVLLVDFLHPEITPAERAWIAAAKI